MTEEALFELALRTPESERAALIDRECGGNPELRLRVEALLAAHAAPQNLLDSGASDGLNKTGAYEGSRRTLTVAAAGTVIAGKYKLLQQIGEGGMGTVWMADQTEPVKRRVAVKLIHVERGSSKTVLSRFEAERQAIALMDHPHIAKLLDAGTTGEPGGVSPGSPFFVMELVKGVPLTDYCDAHKLTVPERLNLFMQICSAVQHAHQKGIIHRDLKPTNILIESHDGKPVPKVIDFGLAKATSGMQLTEHTLFTAFGTVMGTPLYMAPEQAKFNAVDVDTRADVYALGVILYELLTGTTPITRETMKKAALDEMMRIIREQEAPTPSSRLSTSESKPTVAANRQMEPIKLGRFVKGELDWIVMKALSKERDRRYETANGFAHDVGRFLNHEPVVAGPPTVRYRIRKFVQRNKGQVIAAGLVLVALLAGIAGTTVGLVRAEQARRIAEEKAGDARKAAEEERQAKMREAAQLAIAVEQRAQAEKARDRTREVLDAMTSAVTGDSLATQKAITEEQKKFLAEVLTYYKEFAGEKSDDERSRKRTAAAAWKVGLIEGRLGHQEESATAFRMARDAYAALAAAFPVPAYRQDLARSHNNMGNLLTDLGKQAEAESEYRQAQAIQQKLAAEFPAVPAYRSDLAGSLFNLGNLLTDLGKHAEAESEYRQTLAIQERLAAEFPAEPTYRADLAASHNNLGTVLKALGKQAEGEYRKAVAIQEKLAAEYPAVPVYRSDLAQSHNNLGILLKVLGKRAEAEGEYRKALAIKESLTADFPAVPVYRQGLATSHNNLGLLLTDLEKRAEAEAESRKALAIQKKLAAEFPVVPAYRQDLARSHNNLGLVLVGLGKRTEAQAEFRQALAIQEKLAAEYPAVPAYRSDVARSHNNLGAVLNDVLGKPAEAEGEFRKALTIEEKLAADFPGVTEYRNEFSRTSYNFACLCAITSDKVADKKKEYADRAMELLRKAVGAGYKDVAHMKKDTDLDPLRDREDFKKLLAELEKK